jgi:mono/diheme cytochrome c family protein
MTSVTALRGCFVALAVWLCAVATGSSLAPALSNPVTVRVEAQGPDIGTEAQRESGKTLYVKNCAQCHGEKGDGEGYATPHLLPRPRDFTRAQFKVRTTPNGSLPTHQDLVNIIRRGMPYTSMPAWPNLTDQEVSNLAYYITSFSPEFSSPERVPKPDSFPSGPSVTNESIELGKKLYADTGCLKCHGNLGRGDGPSAPTLKDDLGHPIRAANLTQPWTFRGGPTREDIFRTMSTGLNGTPMPSFTDSLSTEQRWAITDFIVSLSGTSEPGYTNLVVAKFFPDPIDVAKGTATFEAAPIARFPILGQITEPGRAFHPAATSLTVQAVYDAESIAFLVRWHDMGADKGGKAGPMLPVPPEEEEQAAGAPASESTSPFGDAEVQQPAGGAPVDPFAEETAPTAAASEFSDAVAIQIPSQATTGARKPYFIFGDSQSSVDLWFFDLARPEPFQFTGRGSADVAPNDAGEVTGVASYDQGEWSAIFKRPLGSTSGAAFASGQFMPIAFSVWDGFSRDRGNRRGLTVWQSVYLEPQVVPSAVGPMLRTALVIFVIELAIIGWVRRRAGSRARADGDAMQPSATRA